MVMYTTELSDYALLDSGKGRKLEQFGPYLLIRPEERAVWKPALPEVEWAADAEFIAEGKGAGGRWARKNGVPERWVLAHGALRFSVELAHSMQVGVFPENATQWDWIAAQVGALPEAPRVLNLFGYTGIASLAAAQAGAQVTHVDAAKRALRLGAENQALSGIPDARIRWLHDDALAFVEREARRGNTYHGLILDPPAFGRGPKGQRWEFDKQFTALCRAANAILAADAAFVVVTAYAINAQPAALRAPLEQLTRGQRGALEFGELVTQEQSAGRKLHYSLSARWSWDG